MIFGQAMDKILGQLTSAPLNKTGPVRQCLLLNKRVGIHNFEIGSLLIIEIEGHYSEGSLFIIKKSGVAIHNVQRGRYS